MEASASQPCLPLLCSGASVGAEEGAPAGCAAGEPRRGPTAAAEGSPLCHCCSAAAAPSEGQLGLCEPRVESRLRRISFPIWAGCREPHRHPLLLHAVGSVNQRTLLSLLCKVACEKAESLPLLASPFLLVPWTQDIQGAALGCVQSLVELAGSNRPRPTSTAPLLAQHPRLVRPPPPLSCATARLLLCPSGSHPYPPGCIRGGVVHSREADVSRCYGITCRVLLDCLSIRLGNTHSGDSTAPLECSALAPIPAPTDSLLRHILVPLVLALPGGRPPGEPGESAPWYTWARRGHWGHTGGTSS